MSDYFLGLSMGTKAVGWAVTDTGYRLLRRKGKDMWGVRLFDEAESSSKRRSFRVSRRLRQRQKERIGYVREVFAPAINAVDPDFYGRLDDSFYDIEDKAICQPNSHFADPDYTDKDYFGQFPTVFHLRQELVHNTEPHDVRLVFLAVLNIFKHRGNFLSANLSEDDEEMVPIDEIYSSLAEKSINLPSSVDMARLKEILAADDISNSLRYDQLTEFFGVEKKTPEVDVLKLMCGMKGTLSKLFPERDFGEENKKYSFSFADSDYDEKEGQLLDILSEEEFDYVALIKQVYDYSLLAGIMKGEKYISDGKVKSYEKHMSDLALLKNVYKMYGTKDQFNNMFRVMGDFNYSSYVGSVNSDLEKTRRHPEKMKDEGFTKRLVKELTEMKEKHTEAPDIAYILNELANGSFLPKQRTTDNRVIPYQVNLRELKKILSNAENYLPFLKEEDESGLTASERLAELFAFQIPYYIGPLHNDGDPSHNAWVVRNKPGKVFPWNFEEMVDVKASSRAFIENLIGDCSYLPNAKVLPRNSLLYGRYAVLNELNKVRVNGGPISVEAKKGIYTDLFRRQKKVTLKKVKNYLIKKGYFKKEEIYEVSGAGEELNTSLASYQKFCALFGVDTLTYQQEEISENIIYWSTVYGNSRSMLREQVEEHYGHILSKEQINQACSLRFQGWGSLSRDFLMLVGEKKFSVSDRPRTVIDRMWEENVNLMECLSSQYTYAENIQAVMDHGSDKVFTELTHEDLDALYVTAPVRRAIWQLILVVKEVVDVMGEPPARVFLEVDKDTAVVNKSQRAIIRKKRLVALYKKNKDKSRDWVKEISDITPASKLLSKKLYLYYMQKGKCMLTGEDIKLSELFDDTLYNIDHIYPKQFVMDESLEKNLILVSTKANKEKGNRYPLDPKIRGKQFAFWKMLVTQKFITKEKYDRLIRSTPFTDEELADFVSAQVTDRRQGAKAVTNILRRSFPDTVVCNAKASAVNSFRSSFRLLRNSDANDLWHAQDAYLNIVVGNAYHVKFTMSPINFIKSFKSAPQKNKYHMGKIFRSTIERDGEVAWNTENDASITTVRGVLEKQTPIVTMMNYTKHGKLWKQTVHSAKKAASGSGYLPLKTSDSRLLDMSRYGGYCNFTTAHFFLVEHTYKKERIRTIETMPLYLMEKYNTKEALGDYCRQFLGYTDPVICVPKIKMYSLVKVDGYFVYITGRSLDRLSIRSAVQPKFPAEWNWYIKRVFTAQEAADEGEEETDGKSDITKKKNIGLYRLLVEKNTDGIFGKKPGTFGEFLLEKEDVFAGLGLKDQVYVLKQIIMYDAGKTAHADLRLIGGSPNSGARTLGNKVSDYKEFKLISMSPAGLHRTVTDLKTV